jgi:type IV secretory pathway VirB3-like protein
MATISDVASLHVPLTRANMVAGIPIPIKNPDLKIVV